MNRIAAFLKSVPVPVWILLAILLALAVIAWIGYPEWGTVE